MSGYARQRHGTVDELDSTGVFTGMQGSNHVHWNANVNVREHERGENSQQRPGRHAGLSHQINAEYCEQLAHTNVSPLWSQNQEEVNLLPVMGQPVSPTHAQSRRGRVTSWHFRPCGRVWVGSHLHCSVLARVDGRVITTTSGSMYVLDDLDRRVATVIDYILKNTIGAPDYDHHDPLNPYMMDLQAFAGKLVYEQPDFPITDVLAGISLLTNNSMGSVFSRAQPEYKLESFQNMVEMARMFALNCNFSINMVADMPKLQGVNYNHPRFKRYSRSLNLLAPANITLRQLLVQFYQLNPESLALTTYHTNLGKFLQLVPEAQTENWVHSCLGLAGDVGNRVKVVWNEGGSGAGDVGPVSGGADLGDVLERTLAELGFRAQEEVKVVGV